MSQIEPPRVGVDLAALDLSQEVRTPLRRDILRASGIVIPVCLVGVAAALGWGAHDPRTCAVARGHHRAYLRWRFRGPLLYAYYKGDCVFDPVKREVRIGRKRVIPFSRVQRPHVTMAVINTTTSHGGDLLTDQAFVPALSIAPGVVVLEHAALGEQRLQELAVILHAMVGPTLPDLDPADGAR